ncbi:MAG: von Willebrand factor type A domain-containing protein [Acidobacteriota bacterium]
MTADPRHHDSQELKRRLESPPSVAEPPSELLERLRADIPAEIPRPQLEESFGRRPRRWQLAAVLTTTILGGGVGYWVSQQAPPLSTAQSESAWREPMVEGRAGASAAEGQAADNVATESAAEDSPVGLSEELEAGRRERAVQIPVAAPSADPPEADRFREESKRRRVISPGDPTPQPSDAEEAPLAVGSLAAAPEAALRAPQGPAPAPAEPPAAAKKSALLDGQAVPPAAEESRRVAPPPPPPPSPPSRPSTRAPLRQRNEALRSRKQKSDQRSRENTSVMGQDQMIASLAEQQAALEKELEALEEPPGLPENEMQAALFEEIVIEQPPRPSEGVVFRGGSPIRRDDREAPPSTGGTAEPNGQPAGDMFFEHSGVNPFLDSAEDALSTFALDVDRASFTLLRRYLDGGDLPPAAALRVEEIVNALDRGDEAPVEQDFRWTAEGARAPFTESDAYRLLRFRMAARDVERPAVALTLVVDVSGSMSRGGRLDLVRRSLGLLLDRLRAGDRVTLVTFGERARVLVESTSDLLAVRSALAGLQAGGSTHAQAGLALAYELALEHLRPGAVNRVVLCSDGVANVGATDADSLLETISQGREAGIELTALGFGMGNYNDVLLERLANQGDGTYGYIDSFAEARELLAEGLDGTLVTVAEDARVQVRIHPEVIDRYRLIGYENRDLADEDFRNTASDGGEIGSGHRVTALYEVRLKSGVRSSQTAATLTLRYRAPRDQRWREQTVTVTAGELETSWNEASPAFRQAALAAELAEILRGSFWAREGDLEDVARRARALVAERPENPEAIELARLAARAAELSR